MYGYGGLYGHSAEPVVVRSICGSTFGRRSELQRDKEKDLPSRYFWCVMVGCEQKGRYGNGKLEQHIRNEVLNIDLRLDK